ncbi:MAG: glycosyl hydrolase, partial [Marinirhabdus sp.]|nr:glycosyl hydrolase [Marinirhabdus sp.]
RSLWIIDDLGVIHQLADAKGKGNYLFKPKDTYRMGGASRSGSLTTGTNHPSGVMTYFNLEDPTDKKVSLSYLNQQGDTIQKFSTKKNAEKNIKALKVEKGANYHTWDMRGEGAERLDGMILWWASTEAPQAVPGSYKVVLEVEGEAPMTQNFNIVPDQNAETDVAGMQRQYNFITEVNKTVDKAHKSIKNIRKINDQLGAFQKQYKDDESVSELVEKAKDLSEQFSEIEKALYQTQNRSGQDPLNFPIKLTNKLAHLNSLVSMDDFPPTQQDVAVKNELTQQVNAELAKFDALVTQEVKAFNDAFNQQQLNYLIVEEDK